ncbi:PAAR domain-containing protein [Geminocystis sp. NIES-3709]|uniref:PAAR domain-containing protein n=1 Tax=Geminocystis sp. NIES-3709 TaxID=1617448 RepID=UPI0005FC76A8|nr:PAAR domain-containing protein [Geminocystis sp. NIES-3709]BAQ65540.1 unncharacterized conserved protein [Geminocystis sp. NIES-3709]
MLKIARIGDAISHGGEIIESSPDCFANDRKIARLGDAVICSLHGTQSIVTASSNLYCNGISAARIGDQISCGATIVESSEDVFN